MRSSASIAQKEVYHVSNFEIERKSWRQKGSIMSGIRTALALLLCLGVLSPSSTAVAQNVKSTSDKSADFTKYKKYTWGPNYLLTQQTKEVQERINMAIVDSINRNLQAGGFVEDDKNPDFTITYEAGGQPKADIGSQRYLYASDMVNYYYNANLTGISSDAWVSSLVKFQITVTDVATKRNLWQATASKKIHDPKKFGNDLHKNVDKFVQETMKSFPPPKMIQPRVSHGMRFPDRWSTCTGGCRSSRARASWIPAEPAGR
jgi:Domain of unknown function (DUF4136)